MEDKRNTFNFTKYVIVLLLISILSIVIGVTILIKFFHYSYIPISNYIEIDIFSDANDEYQLRFRKDQRNRQLLERFELYSDKPINYRKLNKLLENTFTSEWSNSITIMTDEELLEYEIKNNSTFKKVLDH